MKELSSRKPATLEIATLLRKQGAQKTDLACAYVGFDCPDEFIVGYGSITPSAIATCLALPR